MVDLRRLNAEVLAQQIAAADADAADADDADTAILKRLLWGIRANAATAATNAQRRDSANHSGPYRGQS